MTMPSLKLCSKTVSQEVIEVLIVQISLIHSLIRHKMK
jgi:hypothetical protein